MFDVAPDGWSWSRYSVRRDGQVVARLTFRAMREAGDIVVDGERHEVRRERAGGGRWLLRPVIEGAPGRAVAVAEKPSAWRHRFVVRAPGRSTALHVQRPSALRRTYEVREADRVIGRLRQVSMWRRRISVDLPDDLPPQVQVFVVWLVLLLFRRDDSAAAAS